MGTPISGWYPSPTAPGGVLRWWDGARWTEHVRPEVVEPTAPVDTAATRVDVSHVAPDNRRAAEAWHAMKDRGGVAGAIGGVMSAALGAQEVNVPSASAQHPPTQYAPTLPPTDGPGTPLVVAGDLGFARTHDPALVPLQATLTGGNGAFLSRPGPVGALQLIGVGLALILVGVLLLAQDGPGLLPILVPLLGLASAGLGTYFVYRSIQDLQETYRGLRRLGPVVRALRARRDADPR